MPATDKFPGVRVLLVEDDVMICMLFEDMLVELGCEIIGPAGDVRHATDLARSHEGIDVAILDVHLAGQLVFPVADILVERGVPFLFATGLGVGGLPVEWQGHQTLQKPMSMQQLADSLGNTLPDRRRS